MNYFEDLKKAYCDVMGIWGRYWRAYGGLSALILSPYLHVSAILTISLWPAWVSGKWWETTLQIIPNILGFTLAGFTIWLGFGDDKFQKTLTNRKNKNSHSPYIGISAAFVHFIVVQILAVIFALIGKTIDLPFLGNFLGYLLFIYALMTALAATLGVFRTASWYEYQNNKSKANDSSQPPTDGPSSGQQ